MLPVRVVLLPSLLRDEDVLGRSVVVFDVLRATTTIASAIQSGVWEIQVFGSLDDARSAAGGFKGERILSGEHNCLAPVDFDCGNSPGDYTPARCQGRTMFLSTTNGTRALVAARRAERLFTGSIVNARATARALIEANLPITLLCAGTAGQVALEDLQGCGVVLEELGPQNLLMENDACHIGLSQCMADPGNDRLFVSAGGRNILRVELGADISFAAHRNLIDVAVEVKDRDGVLVATRVAGYA